MDNRSRGVPTWAGVLAGVGALALADAVYQRVRRPKTLLEGPTVEVRLRGSGPYCWPDPVPLPYNGPLPYSGPINWKLVRAAANLYQFSTSKPPIDIDTQGGSRGQSVRDNAKEARIPIYEAGNEPYTYYSVNLQRNSTGEQYLLDPRIKNGFELTNLTGLPILERLLNLLFGPRHRTTE